MTETVPTSQTPSTARGDTLRQRLGTIAIELLLLAAVYYFLIRLKPLLLGAIVAVIVVTGLLPGRWGQLASGVGWLGLAALVFFNYGHAPLAIVLALFGIVSLGLGLARPR